MKNKQPPKLPEEKIEQKRTDNGNSTHIIAAQFTEDNFLLKPVNNKYRAYIVNAAKRHGFTPHSLAAVIEVIPFLTGIALRNGTAASLSGP